jgi:hypothetical protein
MAGINKMNADDVTAHFGSIEKFAKTMEKSKVVMAPGVKGHAYMEVGGLHVRMSEVAKKFQELGKNVKPEESEKYASVGIKLAVAERTIKPMNKEGVSIIKHIGTLIRKAVDKLAGPRSRATERIGTYRTGVEQHIKGKTGVEQGLGARTKAPEGAVQLAVKTGLGRHEPEAKELIQASFGSVKIEHLLPKSGEERLDALKHLRVNLKEFNKQLNGSKVDKSTSESTLKDLVSRLTRGPELRKDQDRFILKPADGSGSLVRVMGRREFATEHFASLPKNEQPEIKKLLDKHNKKYTEVLSLLPRAFTQAGAVNLNSIYKLKEADMGKALANMATNLEEIRSQGLGITEYIDTSNLSKEEIKQAVKALTKDPDSFRWDTTFKFQTSGGNVIITEIEGKPITNELHQHVDLHTQLTKLLEKVFTNPPKIHFQEKGAELKTALENMVENLTALNQHVGALGHIDMPLELADRVIPILKEKNAIGKDSQYSHIKLGEPTGIISKDYPITHLKGIAVKKETGAAEAK